MCILSEYVLKYALKYFYGMLAYFLFTNNNCIRSAHEIFAHWFGGVVVITSASHAEGLEFESLLRNIFQKFSFHFFYVLLLERNFHLQLGYNYEII